METILELKDVKKNYGKKEILKGINLTVQEGEIISVLGPSGCGKSTLLNIIAGILPLNAGQVFVRGKEMSSPHKVVPIEQQQRVAIARADRIIVMNQGVIDQIATPAECYESPRTITVAGLLGAGNCVHGAVMEGLAEAENAENRAVVSVQNRKLVCKSFQNVKKGQKCS